MCVVIGHVTCEGGVGRGGVWLACEGGGKQQGEEWRAAVDVMRPCQFADCIIMICRHSPSALGLPPHQADCPSEQESNPGE